MNPGEWIALISLALNIIVLAYFGGRLVQRVDDIKSSIGSIEKWIESMQTSINTNTTNIALIASKSNTPLAYTK